MLCPIVTDRTCPVMVEQLWELTGSDRMLGSCVQSRLESYWKRLDAGVLRSVTT